MLPNQPPPPASTGSGTRPTATKTTAGQAATTSAATPLGQATVVVTNTASQPQTSSAAILPQPQPSTSRFHPYARPLQAAATAVQGFPQATTQPAAQAVPQAAAQHGTPGVDHYPVLRMYAGEDAYPLNDVRTFFTALFNRTGLSWSGDYERRNTTNQGDVACGAILPTSLSFPPASLDRSPTAEIRELMLRVNDEQNSERRRFLLVKVLRAFSESSLLWEGV
ncbi:MAG: hypothetical protein ACRC9R_11185, partial [Enterovibrio sp.]